jgi:hypothetical protein
LITGGLVLSSPLIAQTPGVATAGALIRVGSFVGAILPKLTLKVNRFTWLTAFNQAISDYNMEFLWLTNSCNRAPSGWRLRQGEYFLLGWNLLRNLDGRYCPFPFQSSAQDICRDPVIQEKYSHDPLCAPIGTVSPFFLSASFDG